MISTFSINNWATITILLMIGFMVFLNYFYSVRFAKFISLSRTDEYFIDYINKSNYGFSFFDVILFLFQIATFSLLLVKVVAYLLPNKVVSDFYLFIKIAIYVTIYMLGRYVIGKIISLILNMNKEQKALTFVKTSYLSKVAVVVFPAIIVLYYVSFSNNYFLLFLTLFTTLYFVYKYAQIAQKNQKLIFSNLVYFILYLCALEIAPLFYVFKLFMLKG